MYSEKVMDHFTNPRNVGEIADANAVGEVGNPTCGDIMRIYMKIENNVITDVKFKTFGCGAAVATSSMATEMVKGKTVSEALALTNTAVAQGYKPCGAVIVLNGAWKSSGMAVGDQTAEQDALARSRRTSLPAAAVYTVNQPTTAALDALRDAGVATVYYVNPMEAVVAAGLYTEADYAPVIDATQRPVKVIRMDYAPASDLLKK